MGNNVRSQAERDKMSLLLRRQKKRLPEISFFGSNNWVEFDFAIRVVEQNMDIDDVLDGDMPYEKPENLPDIILSVLAWLEDENIPYDEVIDEDVVKAFDSENQ